jgi:thioredoxin-related protein
MKLRRIGLFAVLVWLMVPVSSARAEFVALSIDNDLKTEIADAAEDGKRLIVMFHEDGCPWCNKMRDRIFPHPKIQAYFGERFVLLEQDIKGDLDLVSPDGTTMTQKKFAQKMRVRGTPTFVFYDTDGQIATRIPGYQDVATFMATGKYVHDGIFKTGKSLARWHMEQ